MGVNSLPKTVTRHWSCDCDLNPGPSAPESSTLTTRLPSHPLLSFAVYKKIVLLTCLLIDYCLITHLLVTWQLTAPLLIGWAYCMLSVMTGRRLVDWQHGHLLNDILRLVLVFGNFPQTELQVVYQNFLHFWRHRRSFHISKSFLVSASLMHGTVCRQIGYCRF